MKNRYFWVEYAYSYMCKGLKYAQVIQRVDTENKILGEVDWIILDKFMFWFKLKGARTGYAHTQLNLYSQAVDVCMRTCLPMRIRNVTGFGGGKMAKLKFDEICLSITPLQ